MPRPFCKSEEDARESWCCQCPPHPGVGFKCVASDCMAWRFVWTHIRPASGGEMVRSGDTHGYCGLAGNPRIEPRGHTAAE